MNARLEQILNSAVTDEAILKEIDNHDFVKGLYHYFDSMVEKPLTPREFMFFWWSLSTEEKDNLLIFGKL